MKKPFVVILMGSKSDAAHGEKIARALDRFGIYHEARIGSAHKTPAHVLDMLARYEALGGPRVYITVAGRSNALSGFVDGQVDAPVIACPPPSEAFGGADLFSSVRMPGGIAPALVLDPDNAALLAAKILGQSDAAVAARVRAFREANAGTIIGDDASSAGTAGCGDKAREECGVVAVHTAEDAARSAFYALFSLQHRGQESAGIAATDGRGLSLHKGLGLVSGAFTEGDMERLTGGMAIGHTRYSTTGQPGIRNAQPFYVETIHGPLALAHNGNLVNAAELRRGLLERGVGLSSSSDSEVMIMMLAAASGADWPERLASTMRQWEGAFSFVLLTRDAVFAARDPWGFRPLCAGNMPGGGSAAASETCALNTLGCHGIVDIEPGRIVELGPDGPVDRGGIAAARPSSCVFEYVYFSRPDSVWNGIQVHEARRRFGAALARESPVDADVVIAVPDSSISAAIGYAQALGIPYDEGFAKNRYIGRTFIQPTQALREQGVALKFNAMPGTVRGKRVVVIDDSLVRGTTTGPLVRLLREAGATAVHVRIACPPIRHPCYMGVDMGRRESLIAHRLGLEEIRRATGADSLGYLSLSGMMDALALARFHSAGSTRDENGSPGASSARSAADTPAGFCLACFSGDYPLDVAGATGKHGFEVV